MSTTVYVYHRGKRNSAYKYEEIARVDVMKDKKGRDQIDVHTKGNSIYQATCDLDEKDVELFWDSYDKAEKLYNKIYLTAAEKGVNLFKNKEDENKKRKTVAV